MWSEERRGVNETECGGGWGWEVPGWETSRHKRPVRAWPPVGRAVANGALDIPCGFSSLSLFLWLEGLLCGLFPLLPLHPRKFALEVAHFPFLLLTLGAPL